MGFKQKMLPVIAIKQVDLYSRNFRIDTQNTVVEYIQLVSLLSLLQKFTAANDLHHIHSFYLLLHVNKGKRGVNVNLINTTSADYQMMTGSIKCTKLQHLSVPE